MFALRILQVSNVVYYRLPFIKTVMYITSHIQLVLLFGHVVFFYEGSAADFIFEVFYVSDLLLQVRRPIARFFIWSCDAMFTGSSFNMDLSPFCLLFILQLLLPLYRLWPQFAHILLCLCSWEDFTASFSGALPRA